MARVLGIAVLLPGLLRVPLPQVDYHNIRHHDGAGEICPHHDHLLRWHPSASQNDDVAVLHWHWLAPQSLQSTSPAGRDDASPTSPPALHAYLPDCVEPDWSSVPVIQAEGRWSSHNSLSGPSASLAPSLWPAFELADLPAKGPPLLAPAAPGPTEGGPLAHAERWNC